VTRRTLIVCACAALAVAFARPVAADDVSGKWKVTSKNPRGERVYDMTLAQSGEKLTVTSKDREGKDVTSEGTVKGAEITWTTKRQGPQGEMVIVYKGKIEGKTMAGSTASNHSWSAASSRSTSAFGYSRRSSASRAPSSSPRVTASSSSSRAHGHWRTAAS